MAEYRASFDASISFSNGGDLTARGFRVDVPSPDVSQAEIAALFVASLGLLMTEAVRLDHVEVFAEPHKGTRGGPSDRGNGRPAPGAAGPLEGTGETMPAPPRGTAQRRLTFTADRPFPGIAREPRHWVRSSPDGEHIVFLARDDASFVTGQVISVNGGSSMG